MEIRLKGLIICVNYSDYLSVTLPHNRRHFEEILIITTPEDTQTAELAKDFDCSLKLTTSFYDKGALFNKWKALEEGYDTIGRKGWLCNLDADILWPSYADLDESKFIPGNLYCPLRRMCEDFHQTFPPPENEWARYSQDRVTELAGYSQIFHASDPVLKKKPWLQQDWIHAGGADSFFQQRWPISNRHRTHWDVLHLGERGVNWCGRATPYLDGRIPKKSSEKRQALFSILETRRQNRNFDHEKLS